MDLTSIFTVFGSIVAIITGLFVVWDRLYRDAPAVFLIGSPLIPGGRKKVSSLRVMNRSERPLIMSWPNGTNPNALRIALNSSTRAIAGSLSEGETSTVIDGKEEFVFPVLKPPNWYELGDDSIVDITIKWRFVQPQIWKRDRSITVSVNKRSLRVLEDEADFDDSQ